MAKKIESIKELKEKYPTGKGLEIHLDNDYTGVYDLNTLGVDKNPVCIFDGGGYDDMAELWSLLFPEANTNGV